MAKGKYKSGFVYSCERCGNEVVVVTEGGGNLICCVKAMQPTGKRGEDMPGYKGPTGKAAAAPAAAPPPPPAAPTAAPAAPRPKVDPAAVKPLYFYEQSAEPDERTGVHQGYDQQIDLICLRYGQKFDGRAYDIDQTLILVEGRGSFFVNGREEELTTGGMMYVPAGIELSIKNTSTEDMFVLAVSPISNGA